MNTEVGCHFLLHGIFPTQGSKPCLLHSRWILYCCSVQFSCSVMSDSLLPHELQHARLLSPWDFPDKNTGMGCYFLLQGIFSTQGLSLGLLHCKIFLPSEPPGKLQFWASRKPNLHYSKIPRSFKRNIGTLESKRLISGPGWFTVSINSSVLTCDS